MLLLLMAAAVVVVALREMLLLPVNPPPHIGAARIIRIILAVVVVHHELAVMLEMQSLVEVRGDVVGLVLEHLFPAAAHFLVQEVAVVAALLPPHLLRGLAVLAVLLVCTP